MPGKQIQTLVEQLRAALCGLRTSAPDACALVDDLLDGLQRELDSVLSEHAGMADELLRVYEQLGIVFEVTRRIPTVHTEDEVLQLFLESLRTTYLNRSLYLVRPDPAGAMRWPAELWVLNDALRSQVEDDLSVGQVTVHACEPNSDGIADVLAAPVFAGKSFVCAIVMTRSHDSRSFEASDMSLLEALSLYCGDVIRNFRLALELRRLSVDMVRALVSAVDQKDAYTSGHSNRVGEYATMLGAEAGLNEEALQMLEWSALLHDVGKIGIRDDVLKKPGKLTDDEFAHIKEHPVRSYEVVRQVPQLAAALDGVRHHHERWDGKGYPDGLAGESIPLQARIIQVADIFDALTTSRSYRAAFDWEKALSILHEEAGKSTDRRLVDIFDRLIRRQVALGRLTFQDATPQELLPTRSPAGEPPADRSESP